MALPNTGITTTMVGQELGLSTRNVGNLCRSEAINKWSRWKPVRHPKVVGLTEGDLIDVKFGLDLVAGGTIDQLINNIGELSYLKPRGSNASPVEPFRIGDFRNYDKSAIIPLGTGSINDDIRYTVYKGGQTSPYWESFSLYTAVNTIGGISYEDLYISFGTLYLGVHLTNDTNKEWYTHNEPLSNVGGQSAIEMFLDMLHPDISSWVGDTEVFFFLTNVKKEQSDTYTPNVDDRFLPIPTDDLNRNPIFINLSWSYPPGSQTYFAFMKNFVFQPNGYQSTATITFSSIGEAYIGGLVQNAEIVFYSDHTYSNEFQRDPLGTFTIGFEEEIDFVIDAYGPTNSDVYWRILVDGSEIAFGAETR